MTYLSDKHKSKSKRLRYIVIIIIILVFYFWPNLRTKLYPYTEPIIISYSNSKSLFVVIPKYIYTYFSSRNALIQKESNLLMNIEHLENVIAEKDAIIHENNLIIDSGSHSLSNTLVMYPVLQDISSIYSTVVLSKGFKDGVTEKSTVYIRGRQPVCIISEVYNNTSVCKLLSADGVKTEGVTASSSVALSLVGIGGGNFISNVVRDSDLAIGDSIYLVSDQTMKLGVITDIIRNNQATSWQVYIRGLYNPVTSSVFYLSK